MEKNVLGSGKNIINSLIDSDIKRDYLRSQICMNVNIKIDPDESIWFQDNIFRTNYELSFIICRRTVNWMAGHFNNN